MPRAACKEHRSPCSLGQQGGEGAQKATAKAKTKVLSLSLAAVLEVNLVLPWHRVMWAGGVLLRVESDPLPDWPLAFSFLDFCLLTPIPSGMTSPQCSAGVSEGC